MCQRSVHTHRIHRSIGPPLAMDDAHSSTSVVLDVDGQHSGTQYQFVDDSFWADFEEVLAYVIDSGKGNGLALLVLPQEHHDHQVCWGLFV